MKKTLLLNWMLVASMIFGFLACDNEPLEGEFITDQPTNGAGEGEFIATVGTTNFSADATAAIYNTALNTLSISGTKANGETIVMGVEDPAVGNFTLTASDGSLNSATYFTSSDFNPYITIGINGGIGEMAITEFDTDTNLVSGTFSFTAVRIQLDANGDPVLDSNGNPLIEMITVSEGSFNQISFMVSDDPGDGGGNDPGDDPMDPDDSFYAEAAGEEFIDISFVANQTVVGGVGMVNLIATTTSGAVIRIDIPEDLGVGTFTFPPLNEPISDGTILYAFYNGGTGGANLAAIPESGTITITEFGGVTGKITATFEFIGKDPLNPDPDSETIAITNGAFNVDYIENTGGVGNELSAETDGTVYEPSTIEVTLEEFGDTSLITIVTASEISNETLTLQFPIDIEAGAYDMSPGFIVGDEKVGFYNPDIGNSILFASSPGVLTITSYELNNGILEGRFEFTAVDPLGNDPTTYAVTNGSFIITLP